MPKKPQLFETPPYAVEQRLVRLGADLRTARVRRKLTIADVAEKIGTGVRAIADAEKGKISTGVGVYIALLWTYGLLDHMSDVAEPAHDLEGQHLALSRENIRARSENAEGKLDNDF
jgi:transcriptional regulator with XRE-family HTH domain